MAAEEAIEAIHRAALQGDAVSVARMLDEDPRLLSSVWHNGTLLTRVICHGRVALVRLLLERGAEINQVNDYGGTALHLAALHGHEGVVSILLSSGADTIRIDHLGWTPLMKACRWGNQAAVRLLLRYLQNRGLDDRSEDGRTALCYACRWGHTNVVRALLLAGADHTIADNQDTTPLQTAEENEHHECVGMIQVSAPLVSRAKGHPDGTVFAVCGAPVTMGSHLTICACVAVVGGRAAACICPPQGQDATR
jgi:ankyrin repeat protein